MKKLWSSICLLFLAQVRAFAASTSVNPGPAEAPLTATKKISDWIVEEGVKYGFQVLGGVVVLIIGWIMAKFTARFLQRFLEKHKIDVTVVKFLVGTSKLVVMAFAVLIALGKFGIEITPFIAGLSVVGFATSFALQGPLSNYASGASLIFTKPFKVGDIIEINSIVGEVKDMTLPRTIIRTVDGTEVIIPNKHIIGEIIHNFSEYKLLEVKIGIGYKSDIDRAITLVSDVLKREGRVLQKTEPKIGIMDFGDSSVNLYARLWCKQEDYWDTLFSLNKRIFEEFKKNGIEIPFPQRDVHLTQEKA